MVNKYHRSDAIWLPAAVTLGAVIVAVCAWLFFSGRIRSLEESYAITYVVLGVIATLAAILWIRRVTITPAKRDPLWFLFRLCGAVSLVVLAVLFLWRGFYSNIPPLWDSIGIFSALALIVVVQILALYRLCRRIRRQYRSREV